MRVVDYQDTDGRWWRVWLPDEAPDSEAHMGIPVGPPSLAPLGLPLAFEVRLHNELFKRSLFESPRPDAIAQAVRAAVRVDTMDVLALYR